MKYFILFIWLFIYSTISAQYGVLDSTFNSNGIVKTGFTTSFCQSKSSYVLSSGKIIACGFSRVGTTNDFAIAKYNIDGSLDNSFSSDGKVTLNIGTGFSVANCIIEQADNKIIVGGYARNSSNKDFALARFNSDGTLDNSFDGDGILLTDFGLGYEEEIYSINIQNDGKIVVAGTSSNNIATISYFALARYNVNGTLDNTFSSDGLVTSSIGSSNNDALYSMDIQNDGKIVAEGSTYNTSITNFNMAIARYNIDGSFDNTFNSNGKLILNIGFSAYSVKSTNDNKLIVGGLVKNTYDDFIITKINNNGTLDNSFGPSLDGTCIVDFFSSDDVLLSLVIQNDNKIVCAGSSYITGNDIALLRINQNGTLDNTFNGNGKIVTNTSLSNDIANSVSIQNDGKIIISGYSNNGTIDEFVLVRYTSGISLNIDNMYINDVYIYPNLVDKNTLINYSFVNGKHLNINLLDINGRLVKNLLDNNSYETDNQILIPSDISSGLYYIQFISEKWMENIKLTIK